MRLPKQLQFSIIALALTVASGVASAQLGVSPDHLGEAQRLLKQGQHAQALSRADAYVLAKPRDPQGRFVKGLILAEMNRNGEAIAVFKKLTEDFPELPEPYNNLAVLYAQEKQFDKARGALEAAIKTHPSYAVAHENLGDVYAKLASQAYGKALQIDGANTAAQNKLALIRDLVSAKPGKAVEPAKIAVAPAALASKPAAPAIAAPPPAVVAAPPAVAVKPAALPALAIGPKPAVPPAPPVAAQPAAQPGKPAPAVVAPAAPTAPAVAPKAAAPAGEEEVTRTLNNWAAAWARKDVKAYLAHYAADFQTPGGQARRAWEEERSSRINKPGKIEVSADKVVVDLHGADKATVRFRQHYKSANLSSSARKTLVFVRNGTRWLIQQERVN